MTGLKYTFHKGRKKEKITVQQYADIIQLKYISATRDLDEFVNDSFEAILRRMVRKSIDKSITKKEDELLNKLIKPLDEIENSFWDIRQQVTQIPYFIELSNEIDNFFKEKIAIISDNIKFEINIPEIDWIDLVKPLMRISGKPLEITGTGRLQQLFFIFLLSDYLSKDNDTNIIYCIEEPEAFLHPHQQTQIAKFLSNDIKNSQLLISTHSAHIIELFSKDKIIRLFESKNNVSAAFGNTITNKIIEFSFRLNLLSAEVFFADVVFLVEGVSEVLLYKAIAVSNELDLGKLNISILAVNGVGFIPYIDLLDSLRIPYVIRTDNDIYSEKKGSAEVSAKGVLRAVTFYDAKVRNESEKEINGLEKLKKSISSLRNFKYENEKLPQDVDNLITNFKAQLEISQIYLSISDLEYDLATSLIASDLREYYTEKKKNEYSQEKRIEDLERNGLTTAEVIEIMQKAKGENMFSFINENLSCFKKLKNSDITKPLLKCKDISEMINK